MERIGFGGGCHWCTEAVFQALRGVVHVDQGFIRSEAPSDRWAEGVIVQFDLAIIDLPTLAEVHLRTHSANGTYSPGGRYRSAIYVFDADQRDKAARTLAHFAKESGMPARTMVLPFVGFKPSEARYRNYCLTDSNRPFCRRYIDPKLAYIQRHFASIAGRKTTDGP
ncbi:peptide-methionine (S)-S-oxide reductase [Sphingomonas sp. LB3N6]|uniref:peptide-methionine (S)-S-oxide reductase n=1 Tax=Sphingomonas fucosidasi TaxID=3096164 RepID=UPI002FC9DA4F